MNLFEKTIIGVIKEIAKKYYNNHLLHKYPKTAYLVQTLRTVLEAFAIAFLEYYIVLLLAFSGHDGISIMFRSRYELWIIPMLYFATVLYKRFQNISSNKKKATH